ncbi:peptide-methionine (S)-S-oxide reductase [Hyphomicrobium methylovorum]|uniref:peptide-methionine (S)-S-oxide reductase MsrA n=1 Tax=Hyphomicrobium methylovorum TaxID=84 RepID=UPI0015E7423E|nr:peptide-methionine (S)-S-oxide reductase MsrA [Hyphomicrobium methylovorum]MBA2124871.1 peptide-methionine (S)-S-oxide reductase [Hyphomicrobium methylovorum]
MAKAPAFSRIFSSRGRSIAVAALAAVSVFAAYHVSNLSAEDARAVPPPLVDEPVNAAASSETAVFAGGCFWGVQGVFQHVAGVRNAVSGYAGGNADTAKYEKVGLGDTGHAESVSVTFDPREISYGKLLQIYFSVAHDPTELNRQGPDHGTQYRSTIFPTSAEQEKVARAYIAQLGAAKVFPDTIKTTVETGKVFYPAEAYHQDFLTRNPRYAYIVINDLPKIAALKRVFAQSYRADPVLVAQSSQSH